MVQLDSSTPAQTASYGQLLVIKARPGVTDQEEKRVCGYYPLGTGANLITHKHFETEV